MKLIAHRGNTAGSTASENKPEYIAAAIDKGYDVEIDVWFEKGNLFLGHDAPKYQVDIKTIKDWANCADVYCHCKNMAAAAKICIAHRLFPFAHSDDDFIILSNGYLWVHPNAINQIPYALRKESIIVSHNMMVPTFEYYAICSDYVDHLKEAMNV